MCLRCCYYCVHHVPYSLLLNRSINFVKLLAFIRDGLFNPSNSGKWVSVVLLVPFTTINISIADQDTRTKAHWCIHHRFQVTCPYMMACTTIPARVRIRRWKKMLVSVPSSFFTRQIPGPDNPFSISSAGWSSGIKLLQSQLQLKKAALTQNKVINIRRFVF